MYSYDADSAAFIKRAQGLTASDCARAGARQSVRLLGAAE